MKKQPNITTRITNPEKADRLLDAEELAPLLSMTPAQVWRLHRLGIIPVIKIGHRTHRYNLKAVMESLAA